MKRVLGAVAAAVAATLLMEHAVAQDAASNTNKLTFHIHHHRVITTPSIDHDELRLFGGFVFTVPGLGIEIRGANALILLDIEARTMLDEPSSSGLPRRGIAPPDSRRRMSSEELRARVEQTMRTFGKETQIAGSQAADRALDLVRYLYFEGGVMVIRNGVEMLRCDRLWISPLDDRIVAENVELRYLTTGSGQATTIVVRGPKLTKSGTRWTGRDLSITSCTASEPHVALAVGEAEIIERAQELEIRTRGQTLQIGGSDVLPLPDAHFFTGSQSQFPIKSASAGYSQLEGSRAEVVVGLPWNTTGGTVHHWLTGRPAEEFRGEWELGVGFIEKRGVPLLPALDYRVEGLYEGRTEAFWLDDSGRDIREISGNLDGSPITSDSRGLIRSQNRVHLGENTRFDIQAFSATDPAVLSEFFPAQYRSAELPETSGYLHHQTGNHLITFGARTNLDSFSYRDNRALSDRFIEELPVLTWNWLAQPIAETPWQTPIVLDVATDIGQRRSDWDRRATARVADETFRADQLIELSAPFALGPINVRPFLSGRATYYDTTVAGPDDTRLAFEGGVQFATRMSRTFLWTDDSGDEAIRHVIAPRITLANRFYADDQPSEFHQFDATDALTERNLVRVEVRNLLQRSGGDKDKAAPSDFMMLDLAQDLWPDSNRDNSGDTLGLFYYDFLVRPSAHWIPFQTFSFALYGDHDWQTGLRTLDSELQFGPLAGLTWTLEYRTDQFVQGAVGISASTTIFERWSLFGSSLYNLDADDFLTYGFGLRRSDHDWSIGLTGGYNPFTDETSLSLEFIPTLPGITRSRSDRFGATGLHDAGFATQY